MSNYIGVNPDGPAGGDLGGTYPNPTVEKIKGVSASDIANGAAAGATALQPAGSGASLTGVVKSGITKSRGAVYQTASGFQIQPTQATWHNWYGTFAAGDLVDFTHAAGVLTYTGAETKTFKFSANTYNRATGTGAGPTDSGPSVNSATPDAWNVRTARWAGTPSITGVDGIVTLSTGDTVTLQYLAPAITDATTVIYFDMTGGFSISE